MKKLLLFICLPLLSISFYSCSGDDAESDKPSVTDPQGTVTVKIDGVLKTYNTIAVDTIDYVETYTINITASQDGSSAEMIQIGLSSDAIGADGIYNFVYTTNSSSQNSSVSSNISVNTKNTLKAAFSGQVFLENPDTGEGDFKPMTEGVIDITY